VNFTWETLADNVFRCRLPFLDVTIGLVVGRSGALLIDTGSTLDEARGVRSDVYAVAGREITHILLTHDHFDHVLGASVFTDAAVYCAPGVASTLAVGKDRLRDDALRHGVDADAVRCAIDALGTPDHQVVSAEVDLGDRTVSISHPGRGHTAHDLIAVTTVSGITVVFCGDLIEESGDPVIDSDSDAAAWPTTIGRLLEAGGDDAVYVPGHGSVVDSVFVRRQQKWLANQGGRGVSNLNEPM
jgi:glyoxylase-like metal-dependent hydrolase (beta-lactamase superfamily II)